MRHAELPAVDGVITAAQVRATAESIAAEQRDDGGIPWFTGEHLDPWDHVESAMALDVAGLGDEARRAYGWSARSQRADGSWPMRTVDGAVTDAIADTNQCAYLAVGVWHHWLITRDRGDAEDLWPAVRAAIDFVLRQQNPAGDIAWAVGADGHAADESLLAGNCSIHQALRCAVALGELVGDPHPEWSAACARLGHALEEHRELFADKSRYAMDWYYPVLSGAVTGAAARAELDARWGEFVEPGWGIRCVADHFWVTGAETCELVLSLDACDERDRALTLFTDVQHLRAADGGYWTGYVVDDRAIWPEERSTWTAASVVLAADALSRCTPANGLFRGAGLAPPPVWTAAQCRCAA